MKCEQALINVYFTEKKTYEKLSLSLQLSHSEGILTQKPINAITPSFPLRCKFMRNEVNKNLKNKKIPILVGRKLDWSLLKFDANIQ